MADERRSASGARGETSRGEAETVQVEDSASEPARTPARPVHRDPLRSPAQPGASVGRHVVLEEIGHGGMGRVLRAYDPTLQREVALKEVRSEMLGREGAARLVAEAQAMAKLSHPNVVAVYDVEEISRRLVIVMEFVAGTTLGEWVDAAPRSWREVVEVFIHAGAGLAAAHHAGLLHRDFKPANVLVSDEARPSVVKVTDFGLAKVAASVSSEGDISEPRSESAITEAGVVVGTPRYMAPEQHRGHALTAAADQYALCVALWEALCDDPPFGGESMGADKHRGPPSWPPSSTPRFVVDAIRRGLAPEPSERWPSVDAFLEALGVDPVQRRNRLLFGAAGVGAVALALAGGRSWAAQQAERCSGADAELAGAWDAERRATVEAALLGLDAAFATPVLARTQAGLDAYAQQWTTMHTEACEATTIRGEQSPAILDLRMACLRRARVELDAVVDVLQHADPDVAGRAHELVDGLPPLSRCEDVDALAQDVEPPLPEDAEAVAHVESLLARADAEERAGRYREAKTAVDDAARALEGVGYEPVRADVALAEALALENAGQYEAAEAKLHEALIQASSWRRWDLMQDAASRLMLLLGNRRHSVAEGLQYRDLALGLATDDPRREGRARSYLAVLLYAQGDYEKAEATHREALALGERAYGPDHPEVASLRSYLSTILHARGEYVAAEKELREALAVQESELGTEHPLVAATLGNLALVLVSRGQHDAAEAAQRRALAIKLAAYGSNHPEVAGVRNNLGATLRELGRYDEAEAEYRQGLAIRETVYGPDHPAVAASVNNLAGILHVRGQYAEEEAMQRRALAIMEPVLGADHPDLGGIRNNIAGALAWQGKLAEAEAEYRRALALREAALGPEHPFVAVSRSQLADVMLRRERPIEARDLAQVAWDRIQRDDLPPEQQGETAFVLARSVWETSTSPGDRARARSFAEQSLAAYEKAGEVYAQTRGRVDAWLDAHPL